MAVAFTFNKNKINCWSQLFADLYHTRQCIRIGFLKGWWYTLCIYNNSTTTGLYIKEGFVFLSHLNIIITEDSITNRQKLWIYKMPFPLIIVYLTTLLLLLLRRASAQWFCSLTDHFIFFIMPNSLLSISIDKTHCSFYTWTISQTKNS